MEAIMISTILVNICIGCFACVGLATAVSIIQSIINNHKREKRGNVIAYTFLVAVYGFIIYNVGKVILYLIRYAVYHIRRDINKYKSNKDKQ